MDTTEVIVYNFEMITNLAKTFNAELDEEIINNLLEIKKNNKFIRRKSPLRLKYKISTANAWRNEREGQNLSENDKLVNLLISNLNKISDQNYIVILSDIKEVYKSNIDNDDVIKMITETICEKAMTEKIYSNLYAKLISDLYKSHNSDIVNYTQDICNKFFEDKIETSLNELKDDIEDYENICKILKNKMEFTGGFIFIANLFKYKIIDYDLVKQYYDSLIQYTNISPKEQIGKYIDAIISIIDNCGEYLENFDNDVFKTNFMEIVYQLISNKKKVVPKYRFKLMDIIEKYDNNWKPLDKDGWQQV